MKKLSLFAIFLMAFHSMASAQTFDEWFRQKRTQKKYLIQQIAALQTYFNYAKEGYDIEGKGLRSIQQIKQGDWDLHNEFFNSLKKVNPNIEHFCKVAAITSLGTKVIAQARQTLKDVRAAGYLSPEEISHCSAVFDFLLGDCLKTFDELIAVTTSGERGMTTDERLKRLDSLYQEMQEKYAFCCSFGQSMGMLSTQREAEHLQINRLKILNGVQ